MDHVPGTIYLLHLDRPYKHAKHYHWASDLQALLASHADGTAQHDPHVHAAVELLIEHGIWLRRPDFTNACIQRGRGYAYVDWDAARAFTDAGTRASTSETAVLDLAVALRENRYRLSVMGDANARAIATAVSRAVGLTAREPAHQLEREAGA